MANARIWRATITPLASIIGSSFLVLGPLLDVGYGAHAPLVIMALCTAVGLFGWAIRFDIERIDSVRHRPHLVERIEALSSAILAFAYVISVAYYLNLFGSFGVSLTSLDDGYHARLPTASVFLINLAVGWSRGFSASEGL